MKSQITGATACCMLLATSVAQADEWDLSVGLGVQSEKSIYKGVGTESNLFPMWHADNGTIYLQGLEAGYRLYDNGGLSVAAIGQYRLEGYEASDSSALSGMTERKGAFELGARASLETAYGEWSVTGLADVSSEHSGHELAFDWEKDIEISQSFILTPTAGISWRSADLNNYYYGVRANEATVNRAVYTADAGTVASIGLDATWIIDKSQMVRAGLEYSNYSSEISDSSIVERDNNTSASVAYIWRF